MRKVLGFVAFTLGLLLMMSAESIVDMILSTETGELILGSLVLGFVAIIIVVCIKANKED